MRYKKILCIPMFSSYFIFSNLLNAAVVETPKQYEEWSVIPFVFTSDLEAEKDANLTEYKEWIISPVAFSTESTGFFAGVGVIKEGLFQPQTTLIASIFRGLDQKININGRSQERYFSGSFISFSDFKLPYTERFFFSLMGFKSYYPKMKHYIDGSNDSIKKDVITSAGDANFFNTTFRYVLPFGSGLDNPEGICSLQDGFALGRHACGDGTPLLTGSTSIGLKTFYQYENSENILLWTDPIWWQHGTSLPTWSSNGLRLFLSHDNTDFDLNPSKGYQFELEYSKDFGWGDSLQSWDSLTFKYNHYFNLDTFSFTKQNVLALSLWTAYSFSWDTNKEVTPGINAHRPPTSEGARLGGIYRLRAYNQNRFSDKAAFYATAEYRTIIDYNPLKNYDFVNVPIEWFQVVGFVEAGRVHEQYNLDLLSDMKYDVGVSLRAMVGELPIRFDVAYGSEGTNMWLMVNQPFDF